MGKYKDLRLAYQKSESEFAEMLGIDLDRLKLVECNDQTFDAVTWRKYAKFIYPLIDKFVKYCGGKIEALSMISTRTQGERIKLLRIIHKDSLQELADKLNVSKTTVARYENNECKQAQINNIAELYSVPEMWIKDGKFDGVSLKLEVNELPLEVVDDEEYPNKGKDYYDVFGIQLIDVLQGIMPEEHWRSVVAFNVNKYMLRAGKKTDDPNDDIEKAKSFLDTLKK